MYGPTNAFSQELHTTKYRQKDETFDQAAQRWATGLSDHASHYDQFHDIVRNMRFMPAGRIQAAIGTSKIVTPYNCYVSGRIEDSFVAGEGNIMQRASEAAATMRMGGGIGYGFSTLRPHNALIKGLGSLSSGPISFMGIFDAICKCVSSSGHRRGAQMGVLRVDHPDIRRFIKAKQNTTDLTGFNLSIAITDEFMNCVDYGSPFALRFGGEIHEWVDAQELWEEIMRATWDWAEPGVLFIDRINQMNNLWYCEEIEATNPCGEQPLPPHGACLLGSFNLVKYLRLSFIPTQFHKYTFDWKQFREDIPAVVRAMDNVVDIANYPLPAQEKEAKSKRRMGIGITGLANTAEALGFPYGGVQFLGFEKLILTLLRDEAYSASAILGDEKGSFPLLDERYGEGKFIKTLDKGVQEMICDLGIRNSHLLSIAPTGTISLAADNVSSSIEPVFSESFNRKYIAFDGEREVKVYDYGVQFLDTKPKVCSQVTAEEHVSVLTTAAVLVDSAVSKTCNVPPTMPWEEFKNIYLNAWKNGAKGCTTFNSGGKRFGIFEADPVLVVEVVEGEVCTIDLSTGRRSCE